MFSGLFIYSINRSASHFPSLLFQTRYGTHCFALRRPTSGSRTPLPTQQYLVGEGVHRAARVLLSGHANEGLTGRVWRTQVADGIAAGSIDAELGQPPAQLISRRSAREISVIQLLLLPLLLPVGLTERIATR